MYRSGPLKVVLAVLAIPGLLLVVLSVSFEPQPRAEFVFVNRGTIKTLDPAAMSWMQDIRLALTIWEGLTTYDPQTTKPIPGAARQPEISDDRLTYTFRLRPEARWSNGDAVTAHDFACAWRRAVEPGTAADYAFMFNHIDGVEAYCAWRNAEIERLGALRGAEQRAARDAHLAEADRRWADTVGLKVLGPRTLRVRLRQPVAYFLDLCAFSIFLPVHHASIQRFRTVSPEGLIYYDQQWTKPVNTHHNGPFAMTAWTFKRSIRLKRNPHYWDRANVRLATAEMLSVPDANTAWLMYEAGTVDWLSDLSMDYASRLIKESVSPLPGATNGPGSYPGTPKARRDVHAFPAFGTYFYNFNCEPALPDGQPNPWIDPRVRQAFTMAVDKQALVDRVTRKGELPATAFIPPGSIAGYPSVTGLPYDPDRARALMAEAGWRDTDGDGVLDRDGRRFPEVVVLFNTGFNHDRIAEAIGQMWREQLGVTTSIKGYDVKTFADYKKRAEYIICRASWFGDYGDPTTFLDMFQSDNGNNDSHYRDAKYDAMLVAAERQPTPELRMQKLAEAETYLVNEGLPLLPLYYYVNAFAFDPDRVRHLYLTPRMMTMLKPVEVRR